MLFCQLFPFMDGTFNVYDLLAIAQDADENGLWSGEEGDQIGIRYQDLVEMIEKYETVIDSEWKYI